MAHLHLQPHKGNSPGPTEAQPSHTPRTQRPDPLRSARCAPGTALGPQQMKRLGGFLAREPWESLFPRKISQDMSFGCFLRPCGGGGGGGTLAGFLLFGPEQILKSPACTWFTISASFIHSTLDTSQRQKKAVQPFSGLLVRLKTNCSFCGTRVLKPRRHLHVSICPPLPPARASSFEPAGVQFPAPMISSLNKNGIPVRLVRTTRQKLVDPKEPVKSRKQVWMDQRLNQCPAVATGQDEWGPHLPICQPRQNRHWRRTSVWGSNLCMFTNQTPEYGNP